MPVIQFVNDLTLMEDVNSMGLACYCGVFEEQLIVNAVFSHWHKLISSEAIRQDSEKQELLIEITS